MERYSDSRVEPTATETEKGSKLQFTFIVVALIFIQEGQSLIYPEI